MPINTSRRTLHVAEMFSSIQGEGRTGGKPAIFLRLQHCNLYCGRNRADWSCDTLSVWRQGKPYDIAELIQHWRTQGWLDLLAQHTALVITGGEPLLQQEALLDFLTELCANLPTAPQTIEVETNATLTPIPALDAYISQYNCSPKGANSGNSRAKRHLADVLRWHVACPKSDFKFVIATTGDFAAIDKEYITPYSIPKSRVWLMPAATDRLALQRLAPVVSAICQQQQLNFGNRLQVQLWDRCTGI